MKNHKKRKVALLILVIVLAVCCCCLAVGAYVVSNNPVLSEIFKIAKPLVSGSSKNVLWSYGDSNAELLAGDNFIVDESRNLVIFTAEIDGNVPFMDPEIKSHCPTDRSGGCIFFLKADTGKLIKTEVVPGVGGMGNKLVEFENKVYLASSADPDSVIIEINKDDLSWKNIWRGPFGSVSGLEVLGKYLFFTASNYPIEKTGIINLLKPISANTGNNDNAYETRLLSIGGYSSAQLLANDQLRIYQAYFYNPDQKDAAVIYDFSQDKIIFTDYLSGFELAKENNQSVMDPVGALYTPGGREVYKYDSQGNEVWHTNFSAGYPTSTDVSEERKAAIYSKLNYQYGTVYVATLYREFIALDAKTGTVKWKINLDTSANATVLIAGNRAYFTGFSGGVWIIDLDKGVVLDTLYPAGAYILWGDSAPILKGKNLYVQNELTGVYKLDVSSY